MLRVLIADDSSTYRSILRSVLQETEGVELVGEAADGSEAVRMCGELLPDLVLLDLEMPVMGGIEALEILRRDHPKIPVAIASGTSTASSAMKALAMGALEVVPKPSGSDALDSLRRSIKRVTTSAILKRESATRASAGVERRVAKPKKVRKPGGAFDLVLIAISTGGPAAIQQVIPKLPADLGVPVVVVQHLAKGFMDEYASNLAKRSAIDVRIAEEGGELEPATVLLAEPGRHLEIRGRRSTSGFRMIYTDGERVHGCRPAADVLFRSAAREFKGRVLFVVMTGMGKDGTDGVCEMPEAQRYCIAQDEETSSVFGMPRAAAEAGLVDEVLPLDRIAARVTELVEGEE